MEKKEIITKIKSDVSGIDTSTSAALFCAIDKSGIVSASHFHSGLNDLLLMQAILNKAVNDAVNVAFAPPKAS